MGRVDTNATQYHQGLQLQEFHQTDEAHQQQSDHFQKPQKSAAILTNNVNIEPQIYPPPPQVPQHLHPQSFHPPPPPPQHHHDHQNYQNNQASGFPQQPNVGLRQINNPPQQQSFGQPVGGIPIGVSATPAVNVPQFQNLAPTQEWSSDLFDCMKDPQLAMMTLVFPCVTFGQIAEIVDYGSTSCATSAALYGVITSFSVILQFLMSCTYRTKMRSRFGLVETPASDWMVHLLCQHCALCQEYRELQARGFDPTIGWMGNAARQQQQQQNQQVPMAPPMQQMMM